MTLRNLLTIFSCASCLAGCVQILVSAEISSGSPLQSVSKLSLHQNLAVMPGKVGVYLQFGSIVDESEINEREANCKIEIRDIDDTQRIIVADSFEIKRVSFDTEYVLYKEHLVASTLFFHGLDAPTAEVYSTTFYLHSDKQPNVLYLTCEYWEDPADGTHLTPGNIEGALGYIMTLHRK